MIGYTMVGTADLTSALKFYDPLFAELGLDQRWRDSSMASWGKKDDDTHPRFFVGHPFDGKPASAGNGVMIAFLLQEPEKIDRLYALAMKNGGQDEGEPGSRPQYGERFYGAYVRDPDGNKLAFVSY